MVVHGVPQVGIVRSRDHDTDHEHNSHDDVNLMLHLVVFLCSDKNSVWPTIEMSNRTKHFQIASSSFQKTA